MYGGPSTDYSKKEKPKTTESVAFATSCTKLYNAKITFNDGEKESFIVDEEERLAITKGFVDSKTEGKNKVIMIEENPKYNLGIALIDLAAVSRIQFENYGEF